METKQVLLSTITFSLLLGSQQTLAFDRDKLISAARQIEVSSQSPASKEADEENVISTPRIQKQVYAPPVHKAGVLPKATRQEAEAFLKLLGKRNIHITNNPQAFQLSVDNLIKAFPATQKSADNKAKTVELPTD